MGPAQVPSVSMDRYFMTLIDDYLRKMWLYFMKSKDQALEKFKLESISEKSKRKEIKDLKD